MAAVGLEVHASPRTEPDPPSAAGQSSDFSTLCQAFQATARRRALDVALRTFGSEVEITWGQYADRVRRITAGLSAWGIGRGEVVALMLTNRAEALLVDTAVMHLGAIPLSLYNTSSPEQLEYVLDHAASDTIVTETRFAERVLAVRDRLRGLRHVVLVDGGHPGAETLAGLEAAGSPTFDFERCWRAVGPDDVATLIYTSGTTGPPKGVEITHGNLIAEWQAVDGIHPISFDGRVISYLPMAHLADRVVGHYAALVTGASLTCVRDLHDVIAALPEAQPTIWLAVPRIWEKLRAALEPSIAQTESKRERLEIGTQLRRNLGLDHAELLLSGAAPIAPEVLQFFADLGLEIYEVWGMTETAAAATLSPKGAHRIGTVGKALPGVELKLADDGELLVRGRIVARGYRNDPEQTAEAIDPDGWLHTGDVAEIDGDEYVRIIDRKKELIINAAGKNMSPANIENALKAACPLIGTAVAIGDQRPYNTALIVLDADVATSFAVKNGLADGTPSSLVREPLIQAEVAEGIELANGKLSRVEQIKKHTLLPVTWEAGGEELTPTLKLRRRAITEKYAAEIEAMYSGDDQRRTASPAEPES